MPEISFSLISNQENPNSERVSHLPQSKSALLFFQQMPGQIIRVNGGIISNRYEKIIVSAPSLKLFLRISLGRNRHSSRVAFRRAVLASLLCFVVRVSPSYSHLSNNGLCSVEHRHAEAATDINDRNDTAPPKGICR